MRLQKFIIPENDRNCPDMFFRGGVKRGREIDLRMGETVTFDTYFNSFSYTKYRKFTNVSSVDLALDLCGRVSARFMVYTGTTHICVCEGNSRSGRLVLSAKLSELPENGFLYPEVTAVEDSVISGGEYSSECAFEKINVCIAICTYKREQYLLRNLNVLRSYDFTFINKVFVSDNGNTLDHAALSDDFVSVFPNLNYGGSGGFSRGMIEAYDGGYSHIVLMDDDVEFYPEVLEHITIFMSVLKEKYKNSRFSAAMLLLSDENPSLQWEMGGNWTGHCIESRKHNVDVCNKEALIDNLNNSKVDYGAWWCFCMPVLAVREHGLSMPFFIKLDDVEYSLRLKSDGPVITMNGAAIFHESFEKKMNMALDYYTVRNELVTCALHDSRVWDAVKLFVYSIGKHLLLYRYDNIPLIIKAVNDFLGGVDFFLNCDEEQLNAQLMQHSLRLVPLKEIPQWREELRSKAPSCTRKGGKLKAFAACFLPAFFLKKEVTAVAVSFASPLDFICRRSVIQYQLSGDIGVLTERCFVKFISYGIKAIGTTIQLIFSYRRIKRDYRSRINEITSIKFWRSHLHMIDISNKQ